YRIDVSTNCHEAEFVGFTNRRPAPHKRIKNRHASEVMLLVEFFGKVCGLRQSRAEQDASKDRTEPLRPPLVNVVNRPIDFLPPALHLRELRNELKGKRIRLDEPPFVTMSIGLKLVIHLLRQLPRLL